MTLFTRRGAILALAMTAGLATGSTGAAADYPSKPITMVIPYRAGGSTETMGRIVADALGAELGTKVVVKTRPGAGGVPRVDDGDDRTGRSDLRRARAQRGDDHAIRRCHPRPVRAGTGDRALVCG